MPSAGTIFNLEIDVGSHQPVPIALGVVRISRRRR